MVKTYVAFCVLLLQLTWIHGLPASKDVTGLRPRSYFSQSQTHIMGGDYVDIDKVPYQLSLRIFWLHACGAVLISPEYALTVAHCNVLNGTLAEYIVSVTAGTKMLFFGGQSQKVKETVSHPKYDLSTVDYDVAVIKLHNPFPVTKYIQPVPLPTRPEDDFLDFRVHATVSGWGVSEGSYKNLPSIWLMKGDVPLVSRTTCQELYEWANTDKPIEITTRVLCAGGIAGTDACKGDSGGPLVHKKHLIGLVSWGIRCNEYPGVYTNLFNSEIRLFIASHTGLYI